MTYNQRDAIEWWTAAQANTVIIAVASVAHNWTIVAFTFLYFILTLYMWARANVRAQKDERGRNA